MVRARWFVSGIDVLHRLAPRLEALGFQVADAETSDGARALVVSRNGPVRAALVPTDFVGRPEVDLPALLATLRRLAPNRALSAVACGRAPTLDDRKRLVSAGVALALYEPIDDGGVRFQMNRALAPSGARQNSLGVMLARNVFLMKSKPPEPSKLIAENRQAPSGVRS